MSSSIILAGLGMAAVGFGGRYIARTMPHLAKRADEVRIWKVYFIRVLVSRSSGFSPSIEMGSDPSNPAVSASTQRICTYLE